MRVRVVKMNGVDIGLFQFDFDLTWACLFMNKHGTTYARYGARKGEHAEEMLSAAGLKAVMRSVLEQHKTEADKKPAKWTTRTPEQFKTLPDNLRSGKNCVHCHMVWQHMRNEQPGFQNKQATEAYPLPENVGITLDHDAGNVVKAVDPKSAAGKAGLREKDRIVSMNGTRIHSAADVSHVLHFLGKGETVKMEVGRGGAVETELLTLAPAGDWRSRDISWRGSMWPLRPAPGFGGKALTDDEKKKQNITGWAMRVNYIVDWGNDPYGKAAQKAGIQKNDVILAVNGKNDFETELDFQAWFRLTQKPGSTIEIAAVRGGKVQKLRLTIP